MKGVKDTMGYDFNADEIFEMACQMERNGAKFYRKMLKDISDDSVRQMMLNFAAMEEAHEKVFLSMKRDLTAEDRRKTIYDPDGETAQYLKAFADLSVFDDEIGGGFILPNELSEQAKKRKIIRAAIDIEWKSIAFYTGMAKLVPEDLGKRKIDDIIKEEMGHVRLLTRNLSTLS